MRIVDAIATLPLQKLLLVEEHGRYAILEQMANRPPQPCQGNLSMADAISQWRPRVFGMFMFVTHNEQDSEKMTERRLSCIH